MKTILIAVDKNAHRIHNHVKLAIGEPTVGMLETMVTKCPADGVGIAHWIPLQIICIGSEMGVLSVLRQRHHVGEGIVPP